MFFSVFCLTVLSLFSIVYSSLDRVALRMLATMPPQSPNLQRRETDHAGTRSSACHYKRRVCNT
jgi:hypothetical protein